MANGGFILCSNDSPAGGDDFIGHIGDIGIVPQGFTIQANIIAAIGGQIRNNRVTPTIRRDTGVVIDANAVCARSLNSTNGFTQGLGQRDTILMNHYPTGYAIPQLLAVAAAAVGTI